MSIVSFIKPLSELVDDVEERAPGYRSEVLKTAKAILQAEDRHRLSPIAIKQEVKQEIDNTVEFLSSSRRNA